MYTAVGKWNWETPRSCRRSLWRPEERTGEARRIWQGRQLFREEYVMEKAICTEELYSVVRRSKLVRSRGTTG